MHHRLYLHLAWTTQDRARLIDESVARFLRGFLRALARKERAYILEIGLVQTHVHVLLRIHPTASIPRLVQRLKGASSAVAAQRGYAPGGLLLRWSKGYSIQSVSHRGLDTVRLYLRQQPHHHPDEAIAGWTGDDPEYDRTG